MSIHRGLWPNMDPETYHADPCPEPALSSSLAKVMLSQTPRHAWEQSPRLNPDFEREHRDTFDLGSAAHTMLLGRGSPIVMIDADDWRTKDARAERDWAREQGKTPLLRKDYEKTELMVEAARRQLREHDIGDAFDGALHVECPAFAEIDGIWCRAMADALHVEPEPIIYDYKTTAESAAPAAVERTIANLGYDVQAAHYIDTLAAATGEKFAFRFVFQERRPPHLLTVIELSDEWLATAKRKIARAREMWAWCLEQGNWPGYPTKIHVLEPPPWHHRAWIEREENDRAAREYYGEDVLALGMQFQAPAAE